MQLKQNRNRSAASSIEGRTLMGRRRFLKATGLGLGATLAATSIPGGLVRKARAGESSPYPGSKKIKTVCNHCSVGCGIIAETQDGVWVRQEMDLTHPINRGSLCCKGASVRDSAISKKRLKTPMKLVNGKYQKISWDQALDEISKNLLKIRKDSGPDSVFWMGSAKFSNEQAYMFRKMAALWGTTNVDHQARV
jgi:formate dehydrogenase major subunit